MVQCKNALADKLQKQDVPCTQWYALQNMHGHIIQQPSLSSRDTPVGTKFTATYVGMIVE